MWDRFIKKATDLTILVVLVLIAFALYWAADTLIFIAKSCGN